MRADVQGSRGGPGFGLIEQMGLVPLLFLLFIKAVCSCVGRFRDGSGASLDVPKNGMPLMQGTVQLMIQLKKNIYSTS